MVKEEAAQPRCATIRVKARGNNEAQAATVAKQNVGLLQKSLVEVNVGRPLMAERMSRIGKTLTPGAA